MTSLIGSFVKGIIFVSDATKKSILKNTSLIRFFKGKLAVIHNGVDIKNKKFKKIKIFNKYKSKFKVLMLSRIETYKGHEDLVDAFAELPEKIKDKYIILFVGNGKSRYLKSLKLRCSFKFTKKIKFLVLNFNSINILKSVDIFFSLTRDFEVLDILYGIMQKLCGFYESRGTTEFLNKDNSEL